MTILLPAVLRQPHSLIEFDGFALNADAWMQYRRQRTEAIKMQKEQTLLEFLATQRMGIAVSTY